MLILLLAVFCGLQQVAEAPRPLIPEGFHLPANPEGPIYSTIPGLQLPAQQGTPFAGFHPIYPYNHLFAISLDDPQPNFDVGLGLHPINILDASYKELFPIFQAQQLQEGGSPNSFLPDPVITNDRATLLPLRPFTPRLGVGAAYSDTDRHIVDGYIDFPVYWGHDKGRFKFQGHFDQDQTSGWFKVPDFDVNKYFRFDGGLTSLADYPDFHFGHSLRPTNTLGVDIKKQFATGKPLWADFANSIRVDDATLKSKDPETGAPLFVVKQ